MNTTIDPTNSSSKYAVVSIRVKHWNEGKIYFFQKLTTRLTPLQQDTHGQWHRKLPRKKNNCRYSLQMQALRQHLVTSLYHEVVLDGPADQDQQGLCLYVMFVCVYCVANACSQYPHYRYNKVNKNKHN
jgi:hypothetical protein